MSLEAAVILLSLLLGVVRVWSYRRQGKGALLALGLSVDRRELANTGVGAAIGFVAIGATFVVAYATSHVAISAVGPATPLWSDLASFLAVPFVEELVFRSALLGGLLVLMPTHKWIPVLCSAALFGALHAYNEHATILSSVGSTLGGLAYGIAFASTERIWTSFGLHFGWNYAMGPLFGFAVSGGRPIHGTFIQQTTVGPSWFTGGEYGPEGGVVGLVGRAVVLALVAAWLAYSRMPVRRPLPG